MKAAIHKITGALLIVCECAVAGSLLAVAVIYIAAVVQLHNAFSWFLLGLLAFSGIWAAWVFSDE